MTRRLFVGIGELEQRGLAVGHAVVAAVRRALMLRDRALAEGVRPRDAVVERDGVGPLVGSPLRVTVGLAGPRAFGQADVVVLKSEPLRKWTWGISLL